MASSPKPRLFARYWPVVWLASFLVPRAQREPWRTERRKRLWHWALFLEERDRPAVTSERELNHWVWHSFTEALWARFGQEETAKKVDKTLRSPRLVIVGGVTALVLVVLLSGFLPVTRSLIFPLPYGNADRVGLGAYIGSVWGWGLHSTVPNTWVNVWRSQNTTLDGIAEYTFLAHLPGRESGIVVGQVSANFFDVLGVGAQLGRTFHDSDKGYLAGLMQGYGSDCSNCLVVSYDFWRSALHGDSTIVGKEVQLGAYRWRILGVLPKSFWFGTRDASAWMLQPPQPVMLSTGHDNLHDAAPFRAETQVARLVAPVMLLKSGVSPRDAENDLNNLIQRFIKSPSGRVVITPVQHQVRLTLVPYLAAFFAGVLIAIAAAYGRYRDFIRGAKARLVARWWAFLILKTSILLLATTLAAAELVRAIGHAEDQAIDPTAWPISIWLCLAFGVVALVWSLRDQRYRCRVCLSKLGLAVMVGDQSRLLLDSGATEFVCPHGHGMLHVSAMETSWIDAEHWTRLDPSWRGLFDDN